MYASVAVDNIQLNSRFTMAEGELRNFTVTEGGIMVSPRHSNTGWCLVGQTLPHGEKVSP